MRRSDFLRTVVGAATVAGASFALAQSYPAKPVKMIIPFPPGGTLDTVGRALAAKLSDQQGQAFIVENHPGGNGVVGANFVAKAPADGYTLLFNASTFTTTSMVMKSVPYNVTTDFAPIALVAKAPLSVAVNKNLPVTNIKSLIAFVRSNPGKVTFAIGSTGSAGHLATELLRKNNHLDYLIVPYRGTAPAFQDLIEGQVDCFIDPILGSLHYHKNGALRVVAVTSASRAPSLPDVPTVGETIPGYEFYSWYGLWGPAKLPAALVQKLNAEVNKALESEMRDKFGPQGLIMTPGSAGDFAKFLREDMARSKKIITEGNIRLE